MKLRVARPEEEAWVNARYADVAFVPSDLTHDLVIVAELDGTPAGLGRIVPVDATSCELGGMLVFEEFRGRGVARAIIDALLSHAAGRVVYCIPFSDLEPLYAAAGFERCQDAPPAVMEKVEWCRRTYPRAVVLMFRSAVAKPPLS